MLTKKKLKNYYFKFWHIQYKYLEKDKLFKSFWFNQILKKNTVHGKTFKVAKFWYLLSKFLKKLRINPLFLILKSINNLDTYISLKKKNKKNYQITYPIILNYTQRFFVKLKLFYNSLRYRKDESYFKKLFFLMFQNFSKRMISRSNFFFNFIWNKKRFFGKNKKYEKNSYKKFNFKNIDKNAYSRKEL